MVKNQGFPSMFLDLNEKLKLGGKQSLWTPSTRTAKRGEENQCNVVFSQKPCIGLRSAIPLEHLTNVARESKDLLTVTQSNLFVLLELSYLDLNISAACYAQKRFSTKILK